MNSKSEDINEENAFANSSKDILKDLRLTKNSSDNSTAEVSTKDSLASKKLNKSPQISKEIDSLLNYIQLDDIGKGSYGRVIKVQRKADDKFFAMKAIEK